MTCIVCPIGCSLKVKTDGDNISVSGNKCPRGEAYAIEEIRSPKRTVTATAQINGRDPLNDPIRRLPVKTTIPCPKEKIPELLKDVYKLKVNLPVKSGEILIANWKNEGIDIVSTRSVPSFNN